MEAQPTSVLVVGGGLVGLSAAVFLSWRGVPTVLFERHPGSSPHPRAIGYTPRTMELFRSVGLGPRIPQVPPGTGRGPRRVRVESLAGRWFEEAVWTPGGQEPSGIEYSPCRGAAIAQDRLEPILRERAVELGADLRLETELLRFEQDPEGVTAWLRGRDGRESAVRAAYLVAADGHRSPVREALGIGRAGRGHLRTGRSVLFRAPLEEYLRSGIVQFVIEGPGFGAFLTTYGDGRWVLFFPDDEERDEETLRGLIYRAIGRSDLPVEIITTGRWEVSALIADRFASGRVFLAGDAAHTLPPNRGGYGANTGIEDAHNLAWKLAAVLFGNSAPELLDTYDAERRPIAWLRHGQIFARPDAGVSSGTVADVPIIDDDAMEFGQLYRSTAVLGADDGLPPALRPEQWSGQPGTRAPHAWVVHDGERVSTLDLFGRGWVLLAEDERWGRAAAQAGAALGITVDRLRVGIDVVVPSGPGALRAAFGLGPGGASLVRPDGYVAWRSTGMPADPTRALNDALGRVSSAKIPVERR
jgi:2-polyprenyl-6-methoxyphenol hydroxylase-like FAD-dependent oxidoreductase